MSTTYKLLILMNILNLLYLFVIDKLPLDYQMQLEIWSIAVMASLLISNILIVRLIPYRQTSFKLLSFITAFSTLWWFCDMLIYRLLIDIDSNIEQVASLLFLSAYVLICIPVIFYQVFRSYKSATDKFSRNGTFCVYKKPKNFFGIFPAIFGRDPFGHRMLVIDGHEFSFKRAKGDCHGIMSENIHIPSSDYFYRKINDVDIKSARKLIGLKWSIWKNCYIVYNHLLRSK